MPIKAIPATDVVEKRTPLSPEQRTAAIENMAQAITRNIKAQWFFEPRGTLYVNDQDTETLCGELYYDVPLFEHGPAVKVRDWVFVMERLTPVGRMMMTPDVSPDAWFICAFRGTSHYSFAKIVDKNIVLPKELLKFVVLRFWPILHPETFDSVHVVDGMVPMHWTTEEFKRAAPATSATIATSSSSAP